jgi:hypothetical protein
MLNSHSIVSDKRDRDGIPYVNHNIGTGTKEENRLCTRSVVEISRAYRLKPSIRPSHYMFYIMGGRVPTKIIWNNSSDCNEFIATPPFNAVEIREAGFPPETDTIIAEASDFVLKKMKDLQHYPKLSAFINDAMHSGFYALIKETPEDIEYKDIKYFLSFGTHDKDDRFNYSISVRLGLNNPNWESIKETAGFMPGKTFVGFVESFPGLVLGHIEYPEFVLPPEYFINVAELLPRNFQEKITISKDKLKILNNYLLFQCDYGGVYRFIGKGDTVYELVTSPFSFTSTGNEFEEWAHKRVEEWIDLQPELNA